MSIDDELLDKLGTYFVYHDIWKRYCIPFAIFVQRVLDGSWTADLAE